MKQSTQDDNQQALTAFLNMINMLTRKKRAQQQKRSHIDENQQQQQNLWKKTHTHTHTHISCRLEQNTTSLVKIAKQVIELLLRPCGDLFAINS